MNDCPGRRRSKNWKITGCFTRGSRSVASSIWVSVFIFLMIISPTSIRKPKLYAKQVTAYDPDHKDSGFCRTVAPSLVLDLVSFQCEFAFLLHFFDRAYDCFNTEACHICELLARERHDY